MVLVAVVGLLLLPCLAHSQQYTVTVLGTLGGYAGYGTRISASGQVTGYSTNTGNFANAFFYGNGSVQNLGTLGGKVSYGFGINASGQISGYSQTGLASGVEHAFLYSNGVMQDLGTLGGTTSFGYGINASGQVTGWAFTSSGVEHAFLYSNGVMVDLNSEIGSATGYTLVSGEAINDSGQIVVDASVIATGQNLVLLLTPTS